MAFSWDGGRVRHQRHLREAGRLLRRATAHDGSRIGHDSAMVTRRAADRVPAGSTRATRTGRLHVMSALGGPASKLSDFSTNRPIRMVPRRPRHRGRAASNAPAISISSAIYVIPTDGGDPRAVTRTKRPASRLGSSVLAGRTSPGVCVLHRTWRRRVTCMFSIWTPPIARRAPPRQLTRHPGVIRGLAWSRDGHSVIYGRQPIAGLGLSLAGLCRRRPPGGAARGGWRRGDGAGNRAVARSPGLHPIVL